MKKCLYSIAAIILLVGTATAGQIRVESELDSSYQIRTNCNGEEENLTDYVNPFIGTGIYSRFGAMGRGNCYPGAVVPFGMVQLSPDTGPNTAGYSYEDNYVEGFSHTHLSGCGIYGFGNILLMPTVGYIKTTERQYRSRFSHENEVAYPGYYSVVLEDYNIKTELTATTRCGFHKYIFPSSDNANILIDISHTLEIYGVSDAKAEIVDNTTVSGYITIPKPSFGEKPYTTYFTAKFSEPFSSCGTWNGTKKCSEGTLESGNDIGVYVTFVTHEDEAIYVKVGLSYVGEEQALQNLESEIPSWDFNKTQYDAKIAWNDALSVIKTEGGTSQQKIIFYTALYHSLLMPHVFSDVNGKYIGFDDEIHLAEDYIHYATFSLWDTFRSEHPLLTLVQPEKQNDMIKSLIDIYERDGWFPRWAFANRHTNCMIGDHSTSVIVDSYLKGIDEFNVSKAYEGMRKSAMELPPISHDYQGRYGLEYYTKIGYAPYWRVYQSVSITLEYCYDDWCLSQIAKSLGNNSDHELFLQRSHNYKNLFDPFTKFMRPKYYIGLWKLLFLPSSWTGFTEGNSWTYTWFVPHDVQGLIDLMGKERFSRRLDYFFSKFVYPTWSRPFSHYWHGNEPDQHVPYLYNYVDQPWKTQRTVRRIMDDLYSTGPEGIPGNDDCGQLSSWYVFSAIGFYPVCPGNITYQIGSPIFNKTTIHLNDQYYCGDEFVIIANNLSQENKYIQSVTLNGEPLTRTWIKHSEIVNGGTLVFEMRNLPSNWGSYLGSD